MPPTKRTASESGASTQNHKKARFLDSRRIKSQLTDVALKDGRLDVPTFLSTRRFEIEQLENTIVNSRKSGSKRAFQKVPRDLRRRAASHNAKRVPKRLQKRALQEMDKDAKPPKKSIGRGHERAKHMAIEKTRTKDTKEFAESMNMSLEEVKLHTFHTDNTGINCRAETPKDGIKYKSRQKNKVWLPTHLWHAKRAHIKVKWGYNVPVRPTAKCYKPTHRAGSRSGAVAWDTSYYRTVILSDDNMQSIVQALDNLGAGSAGNFRYVQGQKSWRGLLSVNSRILGPASVIWTSPSKAIIRIHPAIFDIAFEQLKDVGELQDCSYSIGSIDITGPKSLPALRSILKPVEHDHTLWNTIACVSNSESVPDCILAFDVHDPRLFSSQNFKVSSQSTISLSKAISQIGSNVISESLTSQDCRQKSYKNQASQAGINYRKHPGRDIGTEENDPHIPSIIVKTGNTWTLLLPWHWVQHFWYQLMSVPSIRVGGLEQRQQLLHESGTLYFPDDYIFTDSGMKCTKAEMASNKLKWDKKTPAKRLNYDKLDLDGSPFGCDWSALHEGDISLRQQDEDGDSPIDGLKRLEVTPVVLEVDDRGRPDYGTRIYRAVDNPEKKHLIGFVASGCFDLSQGRGTAIGHIRDKIDGPTPVLLKNIGSTSFRKATARRANLF